MRWGRTLLTGAGRLKVDDHLNSVLVAQIAFTRSLVVTQQWA